MSAPHVPDALSREDAPDAKGARASRDGGDPGESLRLRRARRVPRDAEVGSVRVHPPLPDEEVLPRRERRGEPHAPEGELGAAPGGLRRPREVVGVEERPVPHPADDVVHLDPRERLRVDALHDHLEAELRQRAAVVAVRGGAGAAEESVRRAAARVAARDGHPFRAQALRAVVVPPRRRLLVVVGTVREGGGAARDLLLRALGDARGLGHLERGGRQVELAQEGVHVRVRHERVQRARHRGHGLVLLVRLLVLLRVIRRESRARAAGGETRRGERGERAPGDAREERAGAASGIRRDEDREHRRRGPRRFDRAGRLSLPEGCTRANARGGAGSARSRTGRGATRARGREDARRARRGVRIDRVANAAPMLTLKRSSRRREGRARGAEGRIERSCREAPPRSCTRTRCPTAPERRSRRRVTPSRPPSRERMTN